MTDFAFNQVIYGFDGVDDAFPEVDPNMHPFGEKVIVQLRRAKKKTKGGIILTEDVRDTDKWNEQVGKVLRIGPLAFHNRSDYTPWPEGAWFKVGDYVRVPKHGGDRFTVRYGAGDDAEEIVFATFKELDILGRVDDPLNMKAFI